MDRMKDKAAVVTGAALGLAGRLHGAVAGEGSRIPRGERAPDEGGPMNQDTVEAMARIAAFKARIFDLDGVVTQTARISFGVGAPNDVSSCHVIGEILDCADLPGSLTSPPIRDVQTIVGAWWQSSGRVHSGPTACADR